MICLGPSVLVAEMQQQGAAADGEAAAALSGLQRQLAQRALAEAEAARAAEAEAAGGGAAAGSSGSSSGSSDEEWAEAEAEAAAEAEEPQVRAAGLLWGRGLQQMLQAGPAADCCRPAVIRLHALVQPGKACSARHGIGMMHSGSLVVAKQSRATLLHCSLCKGLCGHDPC